MKTLLSIEIDTLIHSTNNKNSLTTVQGIHSGPDSFYRQTV